MKQLSTSRYQIRSLLGEGGMGRVSLAYDTLADREVALKEIIGAEGGGEEFKQEFWWMTRLRHPNLVEVYDFGTNEAGQPFFTMAVVDGHRLDAQLPMREQLLQTSLVQLCRVLRHLHHQGLVHGDIKPENIRLRADGTLVLMDFGLMARAGQVATVRGTPAYMAPEVIQRAPVDQRADLYAVGVLAYQLLTGRLPFEEDSTAAMLRAHLEEAPLPPGRRKKDLSANWNRLIMRLLAKEPIKRFQSAAEVLEALGEPVDEEAGTLLCSPFVGRETELGIFARSLDRLGIEPLLDALHVTGPAGIGKTRFLDECAFQAQLAQQTLLRAAGLGRDATPYEPFAQLLRQAWDEVHRLDPELVAACVPALHPLLPDLVPASPHRLEPEQEKVRLQGAITDLLGALAGRRGLVLVVDDWHLADPLSAELLRVMRRRLTDRALLLVVASNSPAEPGDLELALAPLWRDELARMVGAMLGAEIVPNDFAAQVNELTGGSPLAVETFLQHVVGQQLLARERGRWVLQPLSAGVMPASLDAIFLERLGHLSPLGLRVLELAGVIGREFELSLLERLLPDVPAERLYAELVTLERTGTLVSRSGHFHAGQPHLIEAIQHRIEANALRDLHTRIAEALEEAEQLAHGQAALSDAAVLRLARHFLAGDRPLKATFYALDAARRAIALFANEQAKDFLTRGLALFAAPGDGRLEANTPLRAEYLALLGDLHRTASELDEAAACYDTALPWLEAAMPAQAALLAHTLVGDAILKQVQSDMEGAVARFKQALPIARSLSDPREELRCLVALGRVYNYVGDRRACETTYEEALARSRAAGDLAHKGECLAFLGLLHVSTEPAPGVASRVQEGLALLREAIAIKEEVQDRRGLNDTHMLMGNAQLALGDLAGAEEAFAKNQAICQELGLAEDEIFSYLNLGLVATERGDHLVALERLRRTIAKSEASNNAFTLGLAGCLEARALLALGQVGQPIGMIEASLEGAREVENRYWELFALVYLIEGLLDLNRLDEAQEALLEALGVEASTGLTEYALTLQLYKAQLAMRQGNFEPAEAALLDALERAEVREAKVQAALACLGLAELALLQRDYPEAIRRVTRALEYAASANALGLAARANYMRGRLAAAVGEMFLADRHFQLAQEAAERLTLLDLLARSVHQRAVLQFPSPQATKLLKRAQDLMIQQVDALDPRHQEAFLSAEGRYVIFMGELPSQAIAHAAEGVTLLAPGEVLVSANPVTPKNDFSQYAESREVVLQQRIWIDELQDACDLLMKQLDFSQVMSRSADVGFVMNHALALALEITKAERGELLLFEHKRMISRAKKTASTIQRIDEDWTHYQELVDEVMTFGEPIYIANSADLPDGLGLDETRSILILPLADELVHAGVMLILGHPVAEASQLVKREVDAVKVLANQLSTSLRNIRLQNEWKEKTQRLEMLNMLSASVTSTLVMEEVLDLVVKLSLEITQADRGFLFLADDENELTCHAARYADGPIANLAGEAYSQSICRRVLETGEALCIEDTRDDDSLKNQKSILDLNLRTVMCVPLRVKQKYLGVLYVDSRVVVNTFTGRDLELLKSIASQAAIAIENARLYKLATVDGLTGLFFRSHFEQRLREEMAKAKKYSASLSYMMMDIDHFKKFNDTYGHATGDAVLAHVAGIIKNGVRQDVDIPCRYGGEEMVVLLPETDEVGARIFAERIRKTIDETILETEEHKGLHVTISIGIATFPSHASDSLDLMEFADQALYVSKRAGRNRVTVFNEARSEGEPGAPQQAATET